MSEEKRALRDRIRQRREGLAGGEVAQRSLSVFKRFLDATRTGHIESNGSVSLYRPIRGEVDTRAFHDHFRKSRRTCLYPFLPDAKKGQLLSFYPVVDLGAMRVGAFGIQEPSVGPVAIPELPEIVLVPGLVFSRDCHRIGYGGGHYDATILEWAQNSRGKMPKLVGLAYDFQVIEGLPLEPHDQQLDFVVTESAVFDREGLK